MKKSRLNHPVFKPSAERSRAAYHEAGHAVVDAALGVPFVTVSLKNKRMELSKPGGATETVNCTEGIVNTEGHLAVLNSELFAGKLDLRWALGSMAGPQAEAIHVGSIDEEAQAAARLDMNAIAACCRAAAYPGDPVQEIKAGPLETMLIPGLAAEAEAFLKARWAAVEEVAAALLAVRTLTFTEVKAIVDLETPED